MKIWMYFVISQIVANGLGYDFGLGNPTGFFKLRNRAVLKFGILFLVY